MIPYLYRYSYLRTHGEAPFGDLEHGASGIREDLRLLLGRKRQSEVLPFVRLLGMRKRHANKERCPCGSGDRVGRRHHRQLNRLRKRLGRYWFRVVEQQLLNDALSGKSSSVRGRLIRWRGNVVSASFQRSSGEYSGDEAVQVNHPGFARCGLRILCPPDSGHGIRTSVLQWG